MRQCHFRKKFRSGKRVNSYCEVAFESDVTHFYSSFIRIRPLFKVSSSCKEHA